MNNDIRIVRVNPEDLIETLQIINAYFEVAQEEDEDEATFYMMLMSNVLSNSCFTDDKRKAVDVMLRNKQLFAVWLALDIYFEFAKQKYPDTASYYLKLRSKFAAYNSREAYRRDIHGDWRAKQRDS